MDGEQQPKDEPTTPPSDVQLPLSDGEDSINGSGASATEDAISSEPEQLKIQAFAKLVFHDGDFYMTTNGVVLGRGNVPARAIADPDSSNGRTSVSSGQYQERAPDESGTQGFDIVKPSSPSRAPQALSCRAPRIMYNDLVESPEPQTDDLPNGESELSTHKRYPFIPIHPSIGADGRPLKWKSISRRHVLIEFNFEKDFFEIKFLGRNGGFVDDEWFAAGGVEPLVNGSMLQIGGIGISFCLPDTPPGETGAEGAWSDEESEMTDDDENPLELLEGEAEGDGEPLLDEEVEGVVTRGRRGGGQGKPDIQPISARGGRKRPGRPPKNGVMSKRQEKELSNQSKSTTKRTAKGKNKLSGRDNGKIPKAMDLEDSSMQPPRKRKYNKRKGTAAETGGRKARESTEQTESVSPEQAPPSKAPKDKKPPKPPKSPSPVLDESMFTPEQLAKPQHSYVVLIHDALSSSETGSMALPNIYKAIERKYPYFKLRVTTNGWQSSVRHNLGQHPAFRKLERDGKGYMWGINKAISIEKEKKRRATPPPQSTSQPRYYPPSQTQQPPPNPYGYPGAQYPNNQMPSGLQYPPNAMPMVNGYSMQAGMQHGALPPRPPFAAPGFPMIMNAKSDATYQSPYDPNSVSQGSIQPNQPHFPVNGMNGNNGPPQAVPHAGSLQHHTSQHSFYNSSQPAVSLHGGSSSLAKQLNLTKFDNLPHQIQEAVIKFKKTLMEDLEDKVLGEKLIQSAIKRALDESIASELSDEADLRQEASIIAALRLILSGVRGTPHSPTEQGSRNFPQQSRAAEVAQQVAESMPFGAAPDSRNDFTEANGEFGAGNEKALKHQRSPTTEDLSQPQGKRQAL
ncbi:uncharacterized protein KY384_006056 [Bacidia gigantensis]|uniref:uncharacterized protein n=1 Tax=Bacidia gigantensis TaxID=2732470 RepID=UPI001D039AAC|nr:uncharacterized protein KY384_006056 [Bacidia gigantensis]KAG8529419.1 hypothetical protein KY384_006056 [Bacidia gigantensis]